MKRKKNIRRLVCTGAGMALIFFSSCHHYQLTRRYKTAVWREADRDWVKISVFSMDMRPETGMETIFRLSPAAQAAFIKAVGEKTGEADAFLKALGSGFRREPEEYPVIQRNVFYRRMVVSVEKATQFSKGGQGPEKPGPGPADRISELLVKFTGLKNGRFLSWNRFETQYETIDLGSLAFEESYRADLEAGLAGFLRKELEKKSTSVEGRAEPGLGYGREMREELSLRQRYIGFSGRLSDKNADLYLQGVTGIDLAGNFSIDFKIEVPVSSRPAKVFLPGRLMKDNQPLSPDELTWKTGILHYPACAEEVACDLSCVYTVRAVLQKDETIVEGDDRVVFVQGLVDDLPRVVLVDDEKLKTRLFYLAAHKDHQTGEVTSSGEKVYLAPLFDGPLYFADHETAVRFLVWLKASQCTGIAGCPLRFSRRSLSKDDLNCLVVEGKDFN